mgnify:CR=1 FL=1|jgi:uncharacterized phage protein (TIGR01671 family)
MRQILFRGKRVDNDEWTEGYLVEATNVITDKKATFIFGQDTTYFTHGEFACSFEVKPETVGQFTGLTDKNDKKIFEGDIIRYANLYDYNCYLESIDNPEAYDDIDLGNIWTIDEVVYGINVGYPAFDLNKHDFDINGLCALAESGQYFYEAIGNIYDNKEILEGKE